MGPSPDRSPSSELSGNRGEKERGFVPCLEERAMESLLGAGSAEAGRDVGRLLTSRDPRVGSRSRRGMPAGSPVLMFISSSLAPFPLSQVSAACLMFFLSTCLVRHAAS